MRINPPDAVKAINTDCYNCPVRVNSIFSELNHDSVNELNLAKSCLVVKKSEIIFEEGAYPHGLFCLRDGKVKIIQTGVDGKEQIVHLAKSGDVMGYRAILSSDKYSCSAIAIERSLICYYPLASFKMMVEKEPKLAVKLMELLSNELKEAEKTITDLAQKSVKERLAQGILVLKELYGVGKDGTINVSITREELANLIGTARETATRLLMELSEEESIALSGKKIKILNHDYLVKVAHFFS